MNPEQIHNIDVNAQVAAMEQAAAVERQQQVMAMANLALRFHTSNPELSRAFLMGAVLTRFQPQIEAAAWHAQHQQQQEAARHYHNDRDEELVGSNR